MYGIQLQTTALSMHQRWLSPDPGNTALGGSSDGNLTCDTAHLSCPMPTLEVAMVTRSTLVWALRSTWWLPEALVMISTPSRPMSM